MAATRRGRDPDRARADGARRPARAWQRQGSSHRKLVSSPEPGARAGPRPSGTNRGRLTSTPPGPAGALRRASPDRHGAAPDARRAGRDHVPSRRADRRADGAKRPWWARRRPQRRLRGGRGRPGEARRPTRASATSGQARSTAAGGEAGPGGGRPTVPPVAGGRPRAVAPRPPSARRARASLAGVRLALPARAPVELAPRRSRGAGRARASWRERIGGGVVGPPVAIALAWVEHGHVEIGGVRNAERHPRRGRDEAAAGRWRLRRHGDADGARRHPGGRLRRRVNASGVRAGSCRRRCAEPSHVRTR